MNVSIIYNDYIDANKQITLGGIQTYISDLCKVLLSLGINTRVVQFARERYVYLLPNGVEVHGLSVTSSKEKARYQELYDLTVELSSEAQHIIIFATDTMIPSKVYTPCIAIQHGVFWDIPNDRKELSYKQIISKNIMTYKIINRINRVNCVVCVDYNFVNWYRAQVNKTTKRLTVIPNYSKIAPKYIKEDGTLKIIFARRLFSYRGTRVFTNTVIRLLEEYSNIEITIAGSGEDEKWMHEKLDKYNMVHFMNYESSESLEIHRDKHIAVIPTVGSEGTSLSLLEAMSAQCAVICTDVGGMTNIVLDGYNGVIVRAGDSEQLYNALKMLIEDPEKRKMLAERAYETVKEAFSYETWKRKWIDIINELDKKTSQL